MHAGFLLPWGFFMETVYAVLLFPAFAAILFLLLKRWINQCRQPGVVCTTSGAAGIEEEGPGWQNCLTVFGLALLFRVALLFFAVLASMLQTEPGEQPRTLMDIFASWNAWDGRHYLSLIEKGYKGYTENGQHLFLVFFPLYVWISRLVSYISGSPETAALAVSIVSYGLGCVYLYRLVYRMHGREAAQAAVLLISVFPFSFFFGSIMTEGLFFFTTAAALYYIGEHKYVRAGIFGALAAMTRMIGVVLVAAMLAEMLESCAIFSKDWRKSLKKLGPQMLTALIPAVGTLIYLLLNYVVDGNAFAFLKHQQHWNQGAAYMSETLATITQNALYAEDYKIRAAIWIPELLLFFVFGTLIIIGLLRKKNRNFILIYAFIYFVINYSLAWPLSVGRYLSCGIAFFTIAAEFIKGKKLALGITASIMAILLGIYYYAFIGGSHIM